MVFCGCVDADFFPFLCWNLFPKFLLTMGSIIEWDVVMSISAVSRVSNIYSFLGVNVRDSCWFCG